MVSSHDRRSLQLSKSYISLELFEITNGRQKHDLNQAYKCAPKYYFFLGGGGGGGGEGLYACSNGSFTE